MFVVIVFYGCSVLSAQRKIMLSDVSNSFRVGDSIRYDLVDMEKLCIPENDESTWDFSNLKYLGKEREEHLPLADPDQLWTRRSRSTFSGHVGSYFWSISPSL